MIDSYTKLIFTSSLKAQSNLLLWRALITADVYFIRAKRVSLFSKNSGNRINRMAQKIRCYFGNYSAKTDLQYNDVYFNQSAINVSTNVNQDFNQTRSIEDNAYLLNETPVTVRIDILQHVQWFASL